MKRKTQLGSILILAMCLAACQHNTSQVPQVTDQQRALITIGDVAQGFAAAQRIEKGAFAAALIGADEHQKFNQASLKFAQVLRTANDATLKAGDSATAKQQIQVVAAALNDLVQSGVVGIKNPTRKAEIQAAIGALQAILAAFGGVN
jgi:hypothetical protein